jgi:hypothetical protein
MTTGRPPVLCRTPDGRVMPLRDYAAERGTRPRNIWRDAVMTWDTAAGLWVILRPPQGRHKRKEAA